MKNPAATIAVMSVLSALMILATFAPTAQAQGGSNPTVLARDDFDGGFDLDWQILHPDFSHWSLSRHPGTLTITTQEGAFTGPRVRLRNLFLLGCPAASGEDFETTACVTLKPVDEFNQAGLVLFNDNDNFVSFHYEWGSGPVTGLGNGLRQLTALAMTKGNRTFTSFHIDQGVERVWLRITKRGDRYTFSTSPDGIAFVRQDTPFVDPYHVFDAGLRWGDGTIKQVGLFASNSCWDGNPPEIETSFDFFEVTALTEGRKAERPPRPAPKEQAGQLLESLHRAILASDLTRVKAVIAEGTDINAKDAQGATAFHWAAKDGNKDIAGLLLGMGASPIAPTEACSWTPLHLAAMEGKNDVVQLLLDKGVPLDRQGFKGRTPLDLAILGGHAETVSLLLQHGAEINVKDSEGKMAIHDAVIQRRENLVRLLIAKGADANTQDDKGRTPLSIAKQKHLAEITDLLSQHETMDVDRPMTAASEPSQLAKDLVGSWILVGTPDAISDAPAAGGRYKFRTGRHWFITQADPGTGVVRFHHGGSYTLDGDSYAEKIEFANQNTASMINTTLTFKIESKGDTCTQIGIGNPYSEVWKRVK